MKLRNKSILVIALFLLALPLVFVGNASADRYVGDGAIHDSTTTGWKIPPVTPGVNGCLADTTKTGRPDCNTVRFPAYTTGAACSASAEFTANKAEWASVCTTTAGVPVNLNGLDRNALQCDKLGGVYARACDGKWTDVPDTTGGTTYQCLRCHNNTYQRNGTAARWKTSTLKHGHKNMLRKVTAGAPWAGPDGVVYTHAEAGTSINWTNATITGTSFTGARQLYYIYGDWMAPDANGVYDTTSAGTAGYAKYSCAACHTTGYSTTNFDTAKQPYLTYPGITSGITGSWDVDGIVCSRCHNVTIEGTAYSDPYRVGLGWGSSQEFTNHESDNFGIPYGSDGALMTALCIECHNSTQTKADPAGQLKTAASGKGFSGHILGNQFLNSPHGKFTGTSGQVGTKANYGTHFSSGTCNIIKTGITSTSGQKVEAMTAADCASLVSYYSATSYTWSTTTTPGSCVTCHDVHQSIVEEVAADEPLRRECNMCHTSQANTSTLKHPTGAGTPHGLAGANPAEACVTCHMATKSVEGSTHLPVHLWRINTDASYSTFPTAAQWSAGTKIAFTAADGTYTNAVWVDIDLACGQCHGGGTGSGADCANTNYAPCYSKSYLAAYANGMHDQSSQAVWAAPTASATLTTNGMTVTLTDTSTDNGNPSYARGIATNGITISWGDGGTSVGNGGGVFTHTYATAGLFSIQHTAKNIHNLTNMETLSASVPPKYDVSVTATWSTGSGNTYLYLKNAATNVTVKYLNNATSGVAVNWTGINAGNYKVQAYRSGKTFSCTVTVPAGGTGNPVPFTLNTNTTVICN